MHHVSVDRLRETNAGVEPLADGVHQPVVDARLDLDLRVPLGEHGEHAAQDHRHRRGRNGQANASRDLSARFHRSKKPRRRL